MPHYNRYKSTYTKRHIEEKKKAKSNTNTINQYEDFIIKNTNESTGIVIETKYSEAIILFDNELIKAHLRKGINAPCNKIIFPGDVVTIKQNKLNEYYIENLIERKNLLSRIKKDSSKKDDIGIRNNIAANVDIAVIVVSAKEPPLHQKLIDRYLLILQENHIDCVICLNKADLKTNEEEKILDVYRKIKVPVIETSTINCTGIEELKSILRGKQAIFLGHSGVGKSSLTNLLIGIEKVKTSHTSKKSLKGRHTTTSSRYYIWDKNSSIIDTPGIRSLDVSNFNKNEIKEYFQEFKSLEGNCKYSNCLHYKEKIEDCIVKQALEKGIISKDRYYSYIRILEDIIKDEK